LRQGTIELGLGGGLASRLLAGRRSRFGVGGFGCGFLGHGRFSPPSQGSLPNRSRATRSPSPLRTITEAPGLRFRRLRRKHPVKFAENARFSGFSLVFWGLTSVRPRFFRGLVPGWSCSFTRQSSATVARNT